MIGADDGARRREIAGRLAAVRERIGAACAAAGRAAHDVTLIAVTKTYPVDDVAHLVALGVENIGENRDQEAAGKAAAMAAAGIAVRWHHIGQLQRNKCRSVASYASVVHSIDREPLVTALAAARDAAGTGPLDVLIQVSLDSGPAMPGQAGGATHRGGVRPADIGPLADAIAATGSLRLAGLMAVAPLDGDPATAFATLEEASVELRSGYPEATIISAGMSGDLEAAVQHGATHVRVGSALLGTRPLLG